MVEGELFGHVEEQEKALMQVLRLSNGIIHERRVGVRHGSPSAIARKYTHQLYVQIVYTIDRLA